MKKIVLTLILFVGIVILAEAQDYTTGVGLRAGFSNGLTIKHFVKEQSAYEILLATRWKGFEITGLYEFHNQAFDVYTVLGLDGVLGMEYNFTEAPINIGIDWKPAFNVAGNQDFWPDGGAISIRYIF